MNITLHIERLVLDGLPIESWQSAEAQAAVEAELARLLTENGLKAELLAGGAIPSLRAEPIQLPSEINAAQLGAQIAQSVYGGIGAESRGGETGAVRSHEQGDV